MEKWSKGPMVSGSSLQLPPNNDLHHFQRPLPYKQLYGKRFDYCNKIIYGGLL